MVKKAKANANADYDKSMDRNDIIYWLNKDNDAKIVGADANGLYLNDNSLEELFRKSFFKKKEYRGEEIYLRGLVEISNICRKNCLYCGIRRGNENVVRYDLSDEEIKKDAKFAADAGYGSVVLQGGERTDSNFVERICRLSHNITAMGLGLTLSLGEQSREVYAEWAKNGAIRYLLRIESSNRKLYERIHPADTLHSYDTRVAAIESLKSCGYFTGTGVMIGLPGQSFEDLADDLLFFKRMEVDMVGMGPYIMHPDTPLNSAEQAMIGADGEVFEVTDEKKLLLSLKMIALLRQLMPWINIASTTALQVLDANGREYGLLCGANIIMPNLTESVNRSNYQLYKGKPGLQDDAEATKSVLLKNLRKFNIPVGWNKMGNPALKTEFLSGN